MRRLTKALGVLAEATLILDEEVWDAPEGLTPLECADTLGADRRGLDTTPAEEGDQ